MSKIRKDIYIEILQYADKKIEFTKEKLFDELNFNQEEKNLFCEKLIHNKLLIDHVRIEGDNGIFSISIEGRFKLLEYEELNEARKSSRDAKRISGRAIGISAVLAIGSILIQMFGSVNLDKKQYHTIVHELHSYGDHQNVFKK